MEQAGLEPTTDDNPQLRPIKLKADKKATVELPGALPLHYRGNLRGRNGTATAGLTRTHNQRAAKKNRRIRDELGMNVLYH